MYKKQGQALGVTVAAGTVAAGTVDAGAAVAGVKPAGKGRSPEGSQGNGGLLRRDFFKVLAAGGAAAAVSACQDKPEKLIPYLTVPEGVEFSPGVALEYATTCMECQAHCGMVVKTREGRPIKAEGNPDNPINQGKLCVRGQASLQTHYNPGRLKTARNRDARGRWQEVAWETAEKQVAGVLSSLSSPDQAVLLTDNVAGSRGDFLDSWTRAVGISPKLVLIPDGHQNLRWACKRLFGRDEVPRFHIEQARYLLNFGSDFLETWLNPVENARQFAEMHAYDDARRRRGGKFVHIGPHRGLTGANADVWLNIRPGTEEDLARGLAAEMLRLGGGGVGNAAALRGYLRGHSLAKAAAVCGLDIAKLRLVAKEFAAASPSLALAGGRTTASPWGSSIQLAVQVLNYLAGNVGRTMVFQGQPTQHAPAPWSAMESLIERMYDRQVQLLIVDGCNPLHTLPAAARFAGGLKRVEMVVSLNSLGDETTEQAQISLPGRSAMERWGDAFPRPGSASLLQPVMTPLYAVKAAEDSLLGIAAAGGNRLVHASYKDYLQQQWRRLQRQWGVAGDFSSFWRESLQRGGVFRRAPSLAAVGINTSALRNASRSTQLPGKGLVLVAAASLRHGADGKGASNPWLQELPDPITKVAWGSWVEIHPDTAKKQGIAHGQLVRLTSKNGQLEAPAWLSYGIHPEAVALPNGLGHTQGGRAAQGVGVNVVNLLPASADANSGEPAWLATRVSLKALHQKGWMVQTDFTRRQQGRHIAQAQTLESAQKGEAPQYVHHSSHRHVSFYDPVGKKVPGYHDPYRWGMSVDMDRCTGCNACVVACYAENNIPVVGKTRLGLGREMAWLTVNRYVEGSGDESVVMMQPMFCQHCDNAGCEPVCPVYATYHNPEGLNAQVYNRCVGTRYCSNNCVYKVRRFNWFNYEWESPLHLQLNPDVTVRTKGVMEKCTFCVQRIHRARGSAHDKGREIQDGEVTPACVQTCPTTALTFGNLTDPQSQVSKNSARSNRKDRVRQYDVLEELNQQPAVTYLRKITYQPLPASPGVKTQG